MSEMDIFKLPGELVNEVEVLFWAVLSRDVNHNVKRALRLRLVCKLFAEAVYPALFRTCRLDDAIFEYSFGGVEYKESRYGAGATRELAQVLCEKDASLNYESVIDTLCWLALDNIQRGPCYFREWGAVTCDTAEHQHPATAAKQCRSRPRAESAGGCGAARHGAAGQAVVGRRTRSRHSQFHVPACDAGGGRVRPRARSASASRADVEGGPRTLFHLRRRRGGDLEIMRLVFPPPPAPPPAADEQSPPPPPADGTYGRIGIRHSFRSRLLSRALDATASPEVYEYLMRAWEPGYRPPRYEHVMCHAARGNIAMVRYLLDHWGEEGGGVGVVVDVNGADDVYHGSTLSWACRHGHEEMVDMLLARGADPNFAEEAQRSGLALHAAVRGGYVSIVRKLLACGARVNGPHAAHRRTILAAMQMEHTELVRLLIERGEPLGLVAKGLVKSMVNLGYESMLDILREHGFEPDRGAEPEVGMGHECCMTCTTKNV
ncbi:hypothetical protein PG997_013972 [Apiospora hydei]|uniref:Ankyrin repeat protein n=1 Tax=Apiospora hydei TaxID=1337664 RepID=A0ABR1V7Q3_9PEZI